jgi:hypothetical protein
MGKQNDTRPGDAEGRTGARSDFENAHGQARGDNTKLSPDAERLEHILCSNFDPNEPQPDDIAPPRPWDVRPGATDQTGEMTDDAIETFCEATDALCDEFSRGGDPLMSRCLTEAERADVAAMRDGRPIYMRRLFPVEAILARASLKSIGDLAVLVTHLRNVGVHAKAIVRVDRGPLPRTPEAIFERWPALSYFRTGDAPDA